jgi:hypothetical protein
MKGREERDKPAFKKSKRRRHRHYRVTVIYRDGEKFARLYTLCKINKLRVFKVRQHFDSPRLQRGIIETSLCGVSETLKFRHALSHSEFVSKPERHTRPEHLTVSAHARTQRCSFPVTRGYLAVSYTFGN